MQKGCREAAFLHCALGPVPRLATGNNGLRFIENNAGSFNDIDAAGYQYHERDRYIRGPARFVQGVLLISVQQADKRFYLEPPDNPDRFPDIFSGHF